MTICAFLGARTRTQGRCGGHITLYGKERPQLQKCAGSRLTVSELEVMGGCQLRLKHQRKERNHNSAIDF